MAALAWARENSSKHPDWITDDTKRGLLTGAAAQDPKLAFKLIGELGLKDPGISIERIVSTARTPEERTTTQWALTLPAGEARDSTLKTIHRNWPEQDPAGAAAFAKTHGIK